MEVMECAGLGSRSRAAAMISGVATTGRPPVRPRSRAAARPSRVPATMSSRMNSASAAKTWNTSRPPGVVVSRASCSEVNPTPRRRRSATVVIRSCSASAVSWTRWTALPVEERAGTTVLVSADQLTQKELAQLTLATARAGQGALAQKVQEYSFRADARERLNATWRPERIIWTGEEVRDRAQELDTELESFTRLLADESASGERLTEQATQVGHRASLVAGALRGYVVRVAHLGGLYALQDDYVPLRLPRRH
jgi:hypothetical protein